MQQAWRCSSWVSSKPQGKDFPSHRIDSKRPFALASSEVHQMGGLKGSCQKMWWKSLCHPNLAVLSTGLQMMDCSERKDGPNLSLHVRQPTGLVVNPLILHWLLAAIPAGQSSPSKACKAVSSIRWSTWAYGQVPQNANPSKVLHTDRSCVSGCRGLLNKLFQWQEDDPTKTWKKPPKTFPATTFPVASRYAEHNLQRSTSGGLPASVPKATCHVATWKGITPRAATCQDKRKRTGSNLGVMLRSWMELKVLEKWTQSYV